jgi:hypothetical protein
LSSLYLSTLTLTLTLTLTIYPLYFSLFSIRHSLFAIRRFSLFATFRRAATAIAPDFQLYLGLFSQRLDVMAF